MTVELRHKFATDGGNLYDAILDPKIASRFVFTEPIAAVVRAESDARVGGRYTVVERRNGSEVRHTGEYLELMRPSRIVFTFGVVDDSAADSTVAIDIAPAGEGCDVRLTHAGVPEGFEAGVRGRWEELFARAERVLEE